MALPLSSSNDKIFTGSATISSCSLILPQSQLSFSSGERLSLPSVTTPIRVEWSQDVDYAFHVSFRINSLEGQQKNLSITSEDQDALKKFLHGRNIGPDKINILINARKTEFIISLPKNKATGATEFNAEKEIQKNLTTLGKFVSLLSAYGVKPQEMIKFLASEEGERFIKAYQDVEEKKFLALEEDGTFSLHLPQRHLHAAEELEPLMVVLGTLRFLDEAVGLLMKAKEEEGEIPLATVPEKEHWIHTQSYACDFSAARFLNCFLKTFFLFHSLIPLEPLKKMIEKALDFDLISAKYGSRKYEFRGMVSVGLCFGGEEVQKLALEELKEDFSRSTKAFEEIINYSKTYSPNASVFEVVQPGDKCLMVCLLEMVYVLALPSIKFQLSKPENYRTKEQIKKLEDINKQTEESLRLLRVNYSGGVNPFIEHSFLDPSSFNCSFTEREKLVFELYEFIWEKESVWKNLYVPHYDNSNGRKVYPLLEIENIIKVLKECGCLADEEQIKRIEKMEQLLKEPSLTLEDKKTFIKENIGEKKPTQRPPLKKYSTRSSQGVSDIEKFKEKEWQTLPLLPRTEDTRKAKKKSQETKVKGKIKKKVFPQSYVSLEESEKSEKKNPRKPPKT